MAKELSKKREKMLGGLVDELTEQVIKSMAERGLSMQEGLTVLSMMVSNIIASASSVTGEDEKEMIECFCESLKL